MNILSGIENFLRFVNDNWTSIMVVIGLAMTAFFNVSSYLKKSTEEKINIAKSHIKETMLKFITEAELNFDEWNQAGSIKRASVIKEIFTEYPILNKVTNQEELIKWIDENIDKSLVTLRDVIEKNNK